MLELCFADVSEQSERLLVNSELLLKRDGVLFESFCI